jgi:hypothetical protein
MKPLMLVLIVFLSLACVVGPGGAGTEAVPTTNSADAAPDSGGAPSSGAAQTLATSQPVSPDGLDPNPPANPVKLIFLHHSTGEAWLADDHGGLGIALQNNNYFVSDTNYDWGPDAIGSYTDIGNWTTWFRGTNSPVIMAAVYAESEQHAGYSRLAADPGGENEIILFKSCFPNSALQGSPGDPIPAIANNPLREQDSGSSDHTISNAKGIYIDLLNYFSAHPEKLFVVLTAPPLSSGTYAANARAFNNWLVNDWLAGYPNRNVAVFDFYNVLTSNGGNANTNDLNQETGHHHRYRNGAIQHLASGGSNTLAYKTGDDHPSSAGDQKATAEFLPLLNIFYHRWKDAPLSYYFSYIPAIKN